MDYINLLQKQGEVINFTPEQVDKEAVLSTIKQVLDYTPAPFQMATSQLVLLMGAKQEQLWDLVKDGLKSTLAELRPEAYALVEEKIAGLKQAQGTIMLFENKALVEDLKETYAMYAEDFAQWSNEHLGMVQLNLRYSLQNMGLQISLQHYNDLLKDKLGQLIDVPKDCALKSLMLFGYSESLEALEPIGDSQQRLKIYE